MQACAQRDVSINRNNSVVSSEKLDIHSHVSFISVDWTVGQQTATNLYKVRKRCATILNMVNNCCILQHLSSVPYFWK